MFIGWKLKNAKFWHNALSTLENTLSHPMELELRKAVKESSRDSLQVGTAVDAAASNEWGHDD